MAKFKVGDQVKIINYRGHGWNDSGKMDKWQGEIMTIRRIRGPWFEMIEDADENEGNGWTWTESDFAGSVSNSPAPSVIITTDGKTTRAMLKNGRQTVKEAKATCAPEDTYSAYEGARIALCRLYGVEPFNCCGKAESAPAVRDVKRPAKVGEYVRMIRDDCMGINKKGDIVRIERSGAWVPAHTSAYPFGISVSPPEDHFVVLENYTPDTPIPSPSPLEVTINGEKYVKAK